jgi:hypothetical protein
VLWAWRVAHQERDCVRALMFLKFNALFDNKKNDNTLFVLTKNASFIILQNTHLQTIFDLKHLVNTIGTLINQSMASENIKNSFKVHNQPEIKNLPQLISIFRYFQGKKTQF